MPLERAADQSFHVLTGRNCDRLRLILLTPGNASNIATAPVLIDRLERFQRLILDSGTKAVIRPSPLRVRQLPYDRNAYRERNLVERLWYRLKD
jgi:hypothetical protein